MKNIEKVIFFFYVAILIFNRAVTKIQIGPIYIYDIILIVSICLYWKDLLKDIARMDLLLIFLIAVIWLMLDMASAEDKVLTIRRFAMALYLITPIIVLKFGPYALKMYMDRPKLTYGLITSGQIGLVGYGISPVMGAVLVGSLVIFEMIALESRWIAKVAGLLCFTILSMGLGTSDGIYRTPILAFSTAWLVYILFGKNPAKQLKLGGQVMVGVGFVAITALIAATVPEISVGIDGVIHWKNYIDFGSMMSNGGDRDRGDAGGTVATRIFFWDTVIRNSFHEIRHLLFGYGHSQSFFQRFLPNMDFVDPARLEPHNTFVGFYYRYGLVGLIFLITYIYRNSKIDGVLISNEHLYDLKLMLITMVTVYGFFEVVLENPQGSVLFWSVILLPRVCEKVIKQGYLVSREPLSTN